MTQWIRYHGEDVVIDHAGNALGPDDRVVVAGINTGKLHARWMSVAEMLALRGTEDAPSLYRPAPRAPGVPVEVAEPPVRVARRAKSS